MRQCKLVELRSALIISMQIWSNSIAGSRVILERQENLAVCFVLLCFVMWIVLVALVDKAHYETSVTLV